MPSKQTRAAAEVKWNFILPLQLQSSNDIKSIEFWAAASAVQQERLEVRGKKMDYRKKSEKSHRNGEPERREQTWTEKWTLEDE